jgi:hypothetical protein
MSVSTGLFSELQCGRCHQVSGGSCFCRLYQITTDEREDSPMSVWSPTPETAAAVALLYNHNYPPGLFLAQVQDVKTEEVTAFVVRVESHYCEFGGETLSSRKTRVEQSHPAKVDQPG